MPERNPERPTESLAVKGPVAAAPVPTRAPKLDFASILKPLLDYQLSAADAANLQNAFRASFRGDDAGAHAATERIKDSAAAQACDLVRVSQWRPRCVGHGNRGLPPRQPRLAGSRRASRARRDRPVPCRPERRQDSRLLQRQRAAHRSRQGGAGERLSERRQRGRRPRADRLRVARLPAQSDGREEDPRPLRLDAHGRGSPGPHRQAAVPRQQVLRRGGLAHLQIAAGGGPKENRRARRRGQARRQCRQAARRHPGEREGRRCRLPLQPHPMAPAQGSRQGSLAGDAQRAARAGSADRRRRLVERAAPQLPHGAECRPAAHRLSDRLRARSDLRRRLCRSRIPRRLDRSAIPVRAEDGAAAFHCPPRRGKGVEEPGACRILARAHGARPWRQGLGGRAFSGRGKVPAIFLRPVGAPGARTRGRQISR